jgi:hypothetical protein
LRTRHDIIKALVTKRGAKPEDTKQIAPLTCRRTVYRLAYGHRHRGATWHDEANGVVWLLAYAVHESGHPDDAFPYFNALDAAGMLLPSEADYAELFSERAGRFAMTAPDECQALLAAARLEPGREHRTIVGGEVGVGVAVEVAETLEEAWVAVRAPSSAETLPILMASFFPDIDADDLEWPAEMPHRPLEPDEICFRHLFG